MCDSTGDIYFSGGSSRIPLSRQSSSDDQDILPHLLVPLSCEGPFQPYLRTGENARNVSVQFTGQDATQLGSDILQRRPSFDDEDSAMANPLISYPESSQRTTSHALSPYATDASRFNDFSSCDLTTLHIADAPLHGSHTPRRGSWPSHSQMGYTSWMRFPPRTARSTASEPPESISDESYQDSDVDGVTQMSPMMSQFQIQASQTVNIPPHHMYHAQALQPSIMTFQLSETMLQPVDDPENRQTLRRLLSMNIAGDELEVAHSPLSSTPFSSSSIPFGGARLQGPSMRLQHVGERLSRTNEHRVSVASSSSVSFPSSHSPTSARIGDQRTTGPRPPKKSKMHQCKQCKKLFPRPSGLETHMNSHSGAKPYKCIVPSCEKRFAVRSNAKRHLRTHGINPSSPDVLSIPRFTIGFEEPMVTQVHETGKQPPRLRWIPHNLSLPENEWVGQAPSPSVGDGHSRVGFTLRTSVSTATSSTLSNTSDDDYEQDVSPSSVDVEQYQSDYSRGTEEFTGSYPNYGQRSRRG